MFRLIAITLLCSWMCLGCKVKSYYSNSSPIQHDIWDALIQKHVDEDGWLDYKGIRTDNDSLSKYLRLLETHHPNPDTWSREERLAYWINAYNAYTVQLILMHYPVESIKDIKRGVPFVNSVWDIEFIEIEGRKYSLNNIEHGILRPKFDEPRIHFAINCASYSCPVLRNEAFVADRLEAQLQESATLFLSDTRRNKITADRIELSSIFKWFKGDFTKKGSLLEFVNTYTEMDINDDAEIEFLEYDWRLNDTAKFE